MSASNPFRAGLSPEAFQRLNQVCDAFEAGWQKGVPGRIEDIIAAVSAADRLAFLCELILIDAEYRQATNHVGLFADYRARFPELAASWLGDLFGEPASLQLTLTVIEGPHSGQVFTFAEHDTFIVGRSVRAHFQLAPVPDKDLRVSRVHFLVEINPPLCRLMDLDSHNGTHVNGKKVPTADLQDGDIIKAGHSRMRVELSEVIKPQSDPTIDYVPIKVPEASPAETGEADNPVRRQTGISAPKVKPPAPIMDRQVFCVACETTSDNGHGMFCKPCRQAALALPQSVPGYLLMREIGRGGMGVVYLACRSVDGQAVALKTIEPQTPLNPKDVKRFWREAKILRDLDHPHIVRFLDMGETSGRLFFVMDYVRGTDAKKLLKGNGPLPARSAVRLMIQLLKALKYAHAKGIVHRDIKPASVLVEIRGDKKTVKLADFGLTRVYQASKMSGLTLQNEMGGTPNFLPPEQVTNFRDAKPPADQYAAAATLYNLLTGEHIYDPAPTFAAQLVKILNDAPVSILTRRTDLPKALAQIIHRALAREPQDRFPNVGALQRALAILAR